jgi:TonB-dependent receptor
MKQHLLLLLFAAISLGAYAQGSITGLVIDEQNLALPGASVYIQDLNKGDITDFKGQFQIVNLPAGNYELTISYIGYQTESRTVSVTDGVTSTLDINLKEGAADVGVSIVVLGDRLKGQAKAINQQKNNLNITNIVAADQIGRFPDANIGDAVKRIPGITMQADQGEARNVIIRGLAPQLNSVMINGERIPSAEGDNRNVQMDLIPADMIQTIEVNKAVTPDMDADAIGGAVNLVTRAAPTNTRLSVTAASGLNLLTNKPIWTGGLIYGDRFANDKIGMVLSASYNDHDFGSDNMEAEWENEVESPVTEEDIEVDPFIKEQDIRTYLVRRVRRSASANFDFKLNENNTIFLRSMYNWRDDWENRYRLRYTDIEPVFEDNSENIIGYEGASQRETKGGIDNNRNQNRRLEDQRVLNLALQGDHLLANKFRLTWIGTYAKASEERLNERYINFESADAFAMDVDVSDPMFPTALPKNPSDIALSTFELDELTEENQYTEEEDLIGRINLEIPLNLGSQSGFIKVGGAYRDKTKLRENNFFEFSPTGDDLETMDIVPTEDQTKENFLVGEQYAAGEFTTAEYLGGLDLTDTNQFEEEAKPDEFLADNFTANETVTAGYLMWNQTLTSKLSAIAGIRVEATQNEYTGNIIEDEETLVASETIESDYLNVLPGVHLKYNPKNDFAIRAAWTNTLARPNYFDLVPFRSIIQEDEEIVEGNPDLEPTTSMNVDLNAEYYFQTIGLVSGGVFYKNVNEFIYTTVNDEFTDPVLTGGDEWTLFRPENGGNAQLFGFEVAVQRQLDFLPGALSGFGVYLNYTYTNSNAEGIRNEDGEERTDISLPGTAPHLVNASLSYENKKLVVRASMNYAAEYVDEVGGGDFTDRYYDRQLFVDLNASYAFTPTFRVFLEGNNLTNQPLRYFQGVRERTMQAEYYNARFNLGVKFDLTK